MTGAASGIGLASALRFAREGAVVVGARPRRVPTTGSRSPTRRAARLPHGRRARRRGAERRGRRGARAARPHRRARHRGRRRGRRPRPPDLARRLAARPGRQPDRHVPVGQGGASVDDRAARAAASSRSRASRASRAARAAAPTTPRRAAVVLLTKNLAMDYGRIGIRANASARASSTRRCSGRWTARLPERTRADPRAAQARSLRPRRGGRRRAAVPRVRRRLVRHRRRAARRRRLHGRPLGRCRRADGTGGLASPSRSAGGGVGISEYWAPRGGA